MIYNIKCEEEYHMKKAFDAILLPLPNGTINYDHFLDD